MFRSKLRKQITELEHRVDYLRAEREREAKRWHIALDMLCAECDIYQGYGMQVYKRCDARNCPIYSKIILLSEQPENAQTSSIKEQ